MKFMKAYDIIESVEESQPIKVVKSSFPNQVPTKNGFVPPLNSKSEGGKLSPTKIFERITLQYEATGSLLDGLVLTWWLGL